MYKYDFFGNEKFTAIEVSRKGGTWEYNWKLCKEWESANPTLYVQQKTSHAGKKIGGWITNQKKALKKTQVMNNPSSTDEEKPSQKDPQ